MKRTKLVPVDEHGNRLGEAHHRSTISDAEVAMIRDLREAHHLTMPEIARRTGRTLPTVRKLVYYLRRATTPRDWKRVEVDDGCEAEV